MVGRQRPHGERTVPIAERGHVPFAVIAVLLLVSSVATIAILEQRSEPRVDRDAEILMDRTETAAQAELRSAVLEATHRAGAAPINATTDSDVSAIASAADQPEAFRRYVKLLVYLEAVERLPAANQSVGPNAHSGVSLDPVTNDPDGDGISPTRAIGQVELDVGYYDDDDVEDGTVNATIHGVEFDGHVDGDEIPPETGPIGVSVGTPVFELNEKMTEYEEQLDKGFFEDDGLPNPADPDGFGQQLAVRLYPNTYAKASWNRFGNRTKRPEDHDFEETVGTGHTEVLANHAIYSVQEETFGTRDPYADRTMRPQYLCMALDFATTIGDVDLEVDMNDIVPNESVTFTDDHEEFVDDLDETLDNESENVTVPVNEKVDFEQELCEDGGIYNDWIFGDEATGELPEVPPVSELIRDGVDSVEVGQQEVELPVTTYAEAAYIEYKLDSARDPVSYLEAEASDIEDEIRGGGGRVERDIAGDLPLEGRDEYDGSPHDIRDELYELAGKADSDASAESYRSPSRPGGSGWSRYHQSTDVAGVSIDDVTHDPNPDGDPYDREIHRIAADATVDVTVVHKYKRRIDNETQRTTRRATTGVDVDLEATIDAEYGFEAGGTYYERYDEFRVEPNPIETDYGTHEDGTFRRGFENALVELTSADGYDTAERDVADRLESDLERSDPDALERTAERSIVEQRTAVLESDDVIPGERTALSESLNEELETVHEEFTTEWERDSFSIEIGDLTDDESPPAKIKAHIQDNYEDEYVDDGPYETPEAKAKQQMRKAYFDRLYYWLDRFDDEHSKRMDDFDDEIDEKTEGGVDGLNDVLGFVQGMANAEYDPDPAELEGSPVHDEAHYEVSGSPTYLTATEVEREQVSAIRARNETVMDTDSDAHYHPMAIQTHNRVPWPGLAALFYLPDKWYVTLNVWSVDVRGEYARLEVSSTVGDPADSDRLTYVAEDSPVDVELSDGSTVQAGRNDPVDFETRTEVIVVMPGAIVKNGGPIPAVADGEGSIGGTVFCSDTWKKVGPDANSDAVELCEDNTPS